MPSIASAPSAAAWNSAPIRRIGQYASGASRMASSPACRVISPWVSRRPTVTATMATEIEASSSRAADDMKAMRSVLIVATRCRWLTSPITSTCRSARP